MFYRSSRSIGLPRYSRDLIQPASERVYSLLWYHEPSIAIQKVRSTDVNFILSMLQPLVGVAGLVAYNARLRRVVATCARVFFNPHWWHLKNIRTSPTPLVERVSTRLNGTWPLQWICSVGNLYQKKVIYNIIGKKIIWWSSWAYYMTYMWDMSQ